MVSGDISTGSLTQPPQQLLIGSKLNTPENKLLYWINTFTVTCSIILYSNLKSFRPNCEVQNLKCQMRHSVWIYNPFIEIFEYDFFRISYCSADATYDHIFNFIATNSNNTMECHAFLCKKRKIVSSTLKLLDPPTIPDWENKTWYLFFLKFNRIKTRYLA